jgi:hypothetical protein
VRRNKSGSVLLERPLEGDWRYIWLEANYVKVREAQYGHRVIPTRVSADSRGEYPGA